MSGLCNGKKCFQKNLDKMAREVGILKRLQEDQHTEEYLNKFEDDFGFSMDILMRLNEKDQRNLVGMSLKGLHINNPDKWCHKD